MILIPKNNGAFLIELRMHLGDTIHSCPFYSIHVDIQKGKPPLFEHCYASLTLDRQNILQPRMLDNILNLVRDDPVFHPLLNSTPKLKQYLISFTNSLE